MGAMRSTQHCHTLPPMRLVPFETQHIAQLKQMITGLYQEEDGGLPMSDEKMDRTLGFLTSHPDMGEILLFRLADEIIGYAILIRYWSNEYGGIMLSVDELYIKEAHRGQGYGTLFFEQIFERVPSECHCIFLEVWPTNTRALRFYEKLGFRVSVNRELRYTG